MLYTFSAIPYKTFNLIPTRLFGSHHEFCEFITDKTSYTFDRDTRNYLVSLFEAHKEKVHVVGNFLLYSDGISTLTVNIYNEIRDVFASFNLKAMHKNPVFNAIVVTNLSKTFQQIFDENERWVDEYKCEDVAQILACTAF